MTQIYNIIITGNLLAGTDREDAISAFADKFKVTQVKAESMMVKAPVVIKKGLDKTKAARYKQVLQSIGLETKVKSAVGDNKSSTIIKSLAAESEQAVSKQNGGDKTSILKSVTDPNQLPKNLPGYKFQYYGKPDYGYITVDIPADETMKVEASAMATMDTNIRMKTKMKGGLGRLVSGESMFINEFTAENGPGEIGIAPGTPGDITHQYLNGNTIFLQNSAFVACSMGIQVETKWQGLTKGLFSGESFFLIRCSGQGDLWFNTYGALIEIDIDGDYVVDSGNIVAFSEGLEYEITKVGGYKSLFFSGEGFVCRFKGRGKLWMQTRGTDAFTSWCQTFRPVNSK